MSTISLVKVNSEYSGPDTDELYNSLKRLSNSTAMSTIRLRRFSPTPIPFKDGPPKQLTFTVNQVYYTNGKSRPDDDSKSEIDEIIGEKRDLYKKSIRVIGTSLQNCVISDMISIDIEGESTRLPLMCKLMIIVEGAAVERGQRVLVADAGVQAGNSGEGFASETSKLDVNLNQKSNSFKRRDRCGSLDELEHSVKINLLNNNNNNTNNNNNNNNNNDNISNNKNNDSSNINSSNNHSFRVKSVGDYSELNGKGFSGERSIPVVTVDRNDHNGLNGSNNGHNGLNGYNNGQNGYNNGHNEDFWKYGNMSHGHSGSHGSSMSRKIYERHEVLRSNATRHKSTESLNYNTTRRSNISSRGGGGGGGAHFTLFDRNTCGGSLSDLPSLHGANYFHSMPASVASYFSRERSSVMTDSYLGLDEYNSTPYYQYQRKNQAKKDFSNSTYEDAIELHIPIRLEPNRMQMHRNEKHILITNEKPQFDNTTIRTFAQNMRRYLTERLSRFEAEITFFNMDNQDVMPHFRVKSPFHLRHHPMTYAYHYSHQKNTNSSNSDSNRFAYVKGEPSVTNLMYVKVINGSLNI